MAKTYTILAENQQIAKKYRGGYPLIQADNFKNWPQQIEEGAVLILADPGQTFIAKGYYGKQNKGDGWVFSQRETAQLDETFFTARWKNALQKRQALFADETTTAFRLFNGEGDHFGGLTVDYYDGYLLFQWYSAGVYTYKEAIIQSWLQFDFVKGIYEKRRFDNTKQEDFVAGEQADFPIMIQENGISYATYLNDGWMTGIFLDQRQVRQRITDAYTNNKRVLNTFSYTGAFSVAAVMGGASATTSVDVAGRSRAKTQEQFEANGIDPTSQTIIVEDVFQYFKYAGRKQLEFDLVVIDPPSFARTKKLTFRVAKDYPNLLKETIAITAEKGHIIASTNYAGYGMTAFKKVVAEAFANTGRSYRIVESYTLPPDFAVDKAFPEGNYLKVLFIALDI